MIFSARLRLAAHAILSASVLAVLLAPALPAWSQQPQLQQSQPQQTPPQKPRPSLDRLVEFFDTVVFGAEIDKHMASTVVAKWQGPMRIAVQGQPKDEHRRFLAAHAETLAKLTGVPIEILPQPGTDSNVTVVFVPRMQMSRVKIVGVSQALVDKLAAAGGCYFLSWQKPAGSIVGAVIVVNNQREDRLINHCILEELTQSMGLPNDTDMVRPSLFSDLDTLLAHSRSDLILIKALYDSRLPAGTPRVEALKKVRPIIAELDGGLPLEPISPPGRR